MAKAKEPRLNEQPTAPARRVANARDGADQLQRLDGHDHSDDHDDERDGPGTFELSDEEFLELFAESFNQSVLPDLPKIPGFHTFWATTNNPRDTIAWRTRMGYSFVKTSDIPGWEGGAISTGDYAGCIGINEMVAMKIPTRRYQIMMEYVHHRLPLMEEEKVKQAIEAHQESAARVKGKIIDETGMMDSIVQQAQQRPVFAP